MNQQRSRVAVTPTTTKHAPTPEQAAAPEPVVTGCLYEAGFTTTGPHPQGGVAIARSIHDVRQRLADSTWTYPATRRHPTAVPDPLHLHTSTTTNGGTR